MMSSKLRVRRSVTSRPSFVGLKRPSIFSTYSRIWSVPMIDA